MIYCSCCGITLSSTMNKIRIHDLHLSTYTGDFPNSGININIINNLFKSYYTPYKIDAGHINLCGNSKNPILCRPCFDTLTKEFIKLYNNFLFRQERINKKGEQ